MTSYTVTQNENVAEILANTLQDLLKKGNVADLVRGLTSEMQEVENVLYDVLSKVVDIDQAEGEQLNLIGRIVDQPRLAGESDAFYRPRLRAGGIRVGSQGLYSDLIAAAKALTGRSYTIQIIPQPPAGVEVQIVEGYDEGNADVIAVELVRSCAAGVQCYLLHHPTDTTSFQVGATTTTDATKGFADPAVGGSGGYLGGASR